MMFPEERIYFHVSSLKSSTVSKHDMFLSNILRAFDLMKQLCEERGTASN